MATSEAVEIAQREADDAERELAEQMSPDESDGEPEPESEQESEQESEPAPAAAEVSEKDVERAMKAIDRAGDSYTRKIAELQERTPLGLVECPLCPIPGFVPELPDPEMPLEQRAAVHAAMGEGMPPELRQSPHLRTCDLCDGEGFLATGSKRDGKRDVPCDVCAGNGYIDARHEQALMDSAPPPAFVPQPFGIAPASHYGVAPEPGEIMQGGYSFRMAPGGAADPYGRIAGHPLWGQPAEAGGI